MREHSAIGTGKRGTSAVGKGVASVVLSLVGLLSVLPILWIVLTGFKPYIAIASKTPRILFAPTLTNYAAVLAPSKQSVVHYITNSVITSVVSTLISLSLAVLSAFALARLRPRGHKQINFLILSMRMMPPIALIVPFYLVAARLHILDTRLALVVAYTGLNIPLATWLLQGFLLDLPKELEEAALIDGCTYIGAFLRIILPLAAPGLSAAAIFCFIAAWNDLPIALVLAPFKATTLTVLAANIHTEAGIDWGRLGSNATIVMLPAILFTAVSSRWLAKGTVAGALK